MDSTKAQRWLILLLPVAGLLALFAFHHIRQSAKTSHNVTMCRSNLSDFSGALESYASEHSGQYPPSFAALTPKYLKSARLCPAAQKDTYSASYRVWHSDDKSAQYEVYCQGRHHAEIGIPADHPALSRSGGIVDR